MNGILNLQMMGRLLLCKLGFHKWANHADIVPGLEMWSCARSHPGDKRKCKKVKVKFGIDRTTIETNSPLK